MFPNCNSNELFPIQAELNYTDMWGYVVNWTDANDGWTPKKREALLRSFHDMKQQMYDVPHFTDVGFKKLEMDHNFHARLKAHVNFSDISHEGRNF